MAHHSAVAFGRQIAKRLLPGRTVEERNIWLLTVDTAWGGLANAGVGTFLPVFLVRLGRIASR